MRMTFSHTCPDDRWAAADTKDADTAQGQKKRWHPHLAQSFMQPIFSRRLHITEKAERQMKLFRSKPAEAIQMWIERDQLRLAARRNSDTNEEAFRWEHGLG